MPTTLDATTAPTTAPQNTNTVADYIERDMQEAKAPAADVSAATGILSAVITMQNNPTNPWAPGLAETQIAANLINAGVDPAAATPEATDLVTAFQKGDWNKVLGQLGLMLEQVGDVAAPSDALSFVKALDPSFVTPPAATQVSRSPAASPDAMTTLAQAAQSTTATPKQTLLQLLVNTPAPPPSPDYNLNKPRPGSGT